MKAKNLSRLISVLMAVCIVVSFCSYAAFAEDEADIPVEQAAPSETVYASAASETAEPAPEIIEPDPAAAEPAAETAEPAAEDVEPAEEAAEEAVEPAPEPVPPAAEAAVVPAYPVLWTNGEGDAVYTATFSGDSGVASINVYYTKDLSSVSEANASSAIARNGDTGEADTSGDGQINFVVVPAAGYSVDSVSVSGPYKNLKGPSDTGADNAYRITKITGDLTISITTKAGEQEKPDPYNYTLTKDGIFNSLGDSVGKSLKIKEAGTYTLTGIDLSDYVDGRVQVQSENVTLILKDVWLSYTGSATINAKYDTIIAVEGVNFLTRVIDESDPTDDGGKVIKGESEDIGKSVSLTFTGDGSLTITAPKKGIGVDVFYGEDINPDITSTPLDATITFDGPTINIYSQHECVEANVVNFNAGGGTLVSYQDDGVNVATDGDDTDEDDVDGDGNTREYMYPNLVRNIDFTKLAANINGGTWVVMSNNDGLDSNGNITINGGEMQVYGSTSGMNSAVDYGAETRGTQFAYSDGTLFAVGMSNMQEVPTSGNYLYFDSLKIRANSTITISDANGNVLYTAKGVKSANCILFCSDDLVKGDTYTVTVDGVKSTAVAGESNRRGSGEPGRRGSDEPETTPSTTKTSGGGNNRKTSPKTGDGQNAALWIGVLALCSCTAAVVLPRRKRWHI